MADSQTVKHEDNAPKKEKLDIIREQRRKAAKKYYYNNKEKVKSNIQAKKEKEKRDIENEMTKLKGEKKILIDLLLQNNISLPSDVDFDSIPESNNVQESECCPIEILRGPRKGQSCNRKLTSNGTCPYHK